jgi:hypothetical protein
MRERLHLRNRPDNGQALVIVLVVSILVIAAIGIAFTTARAGLNESIGFKQGTQGEMAAQTGLAYELTAMRTTSAYSALPCSLTGSLGVTGATSTYSVAVSYSASGTALSCTGSGSTLGGSTAPTNATLTSTGKARYGSTSIMKEDVTIAESATTEQALGYAIFTSNNLDLEDSVTLDGTGVDVPSIYSGQQLTCNNSTKSAGGLTSYYPVDLTTSCTFCSGATNCNVTSASYVEMSNSAKVGGNVISYGGNATCQGICLDTSASIGGTATETNGNIALSNSATITGNAYASGTISLATSGKIGPPGTQYPDDSPFSNDSSLSSLTMPAADTFPALYLPTTGWNIVSIPNSSCSAYFKSNGQFQSALENQTERTIYEAPTCSVAFSPSQVFAQNPSPNGDAILDVASLTSGPSDTFCEESATDSHTCSSATTPGANLILFAGPSPAPPPASPTCSTSTVDASFSNSTNFEPNITVLIYSLGEVDYANSPSMTGQILACGGVSGTNSFTLTFNPSAADEVFGTPSSTLTVAINDKYVVSG